MPRDSLKRSPYLTFISTLRASTSTACSVLKCFTPLCWIKGCFSLLLTRESASCNRMHWTPVHARTCTVSVFSRKMSSSANKLARRWGCGNNLLHQMISHMASRRWIGLSWKRRARVRLIQWLLIVTGTYCQAALLLCVCVYLCVSVAACLLQLPEIESRVNCERQLGHTIFRPEVPHIYLLLKKMHFHFLQAEGQMVKKVTLFLFCRSLPPTYYLHI